ncbi:hypothetical protein BJV78DRAFT_1263297 [Lactifluus subvellereus]|nr:hypothetical protein BJV78DRAFT_1263297 [Lactifluus subvellereus]
MFLSLALSSMLLLLRAVTPLQMLSPRLVGTFGLLRRLETIITGAHRSTPLLFITNTCVHCVIRSTWALTLALTLSVGTSSRSPSRWSPRTKENVEADRDNNFDEDPVGRRPL